jgi:hypothetical protein
VRSEAFDVVNRTASWPEGYDGRAIANGIIEDSNSALSIEQRIKKYDDSLKNDEEDIQVIWAGDAIGFINNKTDTKV